MPTPRPLPHSGQGFETRKGSLGVWTAAPGLLIFRFTGYGEGSFADPVISAFEAALSEADRVQMFFDMEEMHNYDSELRVRLTQRFVADRARIAALVVLVRSKIVAMGASVANLALGGILTSCTTRASFNAQLVPALRAKGASFAPDSL